MDLWKAFDTVIWDFLFWALERFGFLDVIIGWIKMCISTMKLSVRINGELVGFLAGARGVRPGDPLPHYLFVLVMEVLSLILGKEIRESHEFKFHCRCEKVKLTHLCFPDGLLPCFVKGILSPSES